MKLVSRAAAPAELNSASFVVGFTTTTLWAIAILGSVPTFLSWILIVSPGLALISVTLNFMSSPPVISTVRAAPAGLAPGFAVAGFGAGAWAAREVSATGRLSASRATRRNRFMSLILA